MRVTEKGQVTIPQNVREHLGIVPGTEVEFSFTDGGAILRKVEGVSDAPDDAQDLIRHLNRHKGSMNLGGLSPDAFMKMLRD